MPKPGLTKLAGNSYVLNAAAIPPSTIGNMDWVYVAGRELGGDKLSQWLATASTGSSTRYGFAETDVVLFAIRGIGTVEISGREFLFTKNSGIYVAPGETFALTAIDDSPVRLLIGVCPESVNEPQLDLNGGAFDETIPVRVIPLAKQEQHATADRFYQLLVNEALGNCQVTQFIGRIPPSRAAEHFHEYEEIIMVLDGVGRLWTGNLNAPLEPGSIIYLPRRQPHCVECTSDDGMRLVGMFYPAGSPAVRY